MIQKDKHPIAKALFGVAAIQGIVGILGYVIYGEQLNLFDKIISFSFILYIALGIWALLKPLPPAIIGFVLYMAFLIFQASQSLARFSAGWLFKLPITGLLIYAVISAILVWRKSASRCSTPRNSV